MRERDRERKENRQEEEEESEEDDKDKDEKTKKNETRTRRELNFSDESYSSPRRNRREEQKTARAKEMNDGSKLDHAPANTGRDTTRSPNRRRREQREWDESSIDTDYADYRHSHRRRQVEVQTKPDAGQVGNEEENREGRVQPHRGLAAAGGQDNVPKVDKVSRKGMAAAGGAAASSSSEEEDKKKQNKGARNTDDGVPLVDKVSRKGMAAVEKKQSSSESAEGKVKPHRGLAAAGTNLEDDRPRNRRHLTSKFVPSSILIDREKLNERDGDDFWVASARQSVDDSSEYAVERDERRNTQGKRRSIPFSSSSSEQKLAF